MFSCEFSEILKKTYFEEQLRTATFLWGYNPGHNILELYNVLVQIRFTTSKRKLGI